MLRTSKMVHESDHLASHHQDAMTEFGEGATLHQQDAMTEFGVGIFASMALGIGAAVMISNSGHGAHKTLHIIGAAALLVIAAVCARAGYKRLKAAFPGMNSHAYGSGK